MRLSGSVLEASQQVDDVREEDQADDGEKHQHQYVHHDGDAGGGDEYWRDGAKGALEIGKDRAGSEQ